MKKAFNTRNRLLFVLALILAISFVGISVLNYKITKASVQHEIIQNDLPLTRDNIYSELSSVLTRPITVSTSMGSDSFLKDWALDDERDLDKITRYLAQLRDRYDYFSTFFVSAKTRRYYHFKGFHKEISRYDAHDVWFYRFIVSGKEYDLDVDTDEASDNVLTVFVNCRLVDSTGELLGVTGVGLQVDSVARLIMDYQEKYDRSIYLVDAYGIVQVHSDKQLIDKANIRDMEGISSLAKAILKTRVEPQNFQFTRGGKNIFLTVRYVPELDWIIFVEQDEGKALAAARRNFIHTILIGIGSSVVIIALTLTTINVYQRRVEALATTDELTGAANRRRLEFVFQNAVYTHERYNRPLSLVLLDLDKFKPVNDQLGHLAGDQLLIRITRIISSAIRPTDLLARWGGDEFVVLTESTLADAMGITERIRAIMIEADLAGPEAIKDDPRRKVTLCCGLTEYSAGDSLDAMVLRADAAMYAGKARGGNIALKDVN
ncbi:sensor domain-containing diguanylate cyclase [Desulfocurvibacter africanus]|uniref:sensor domain-containing diguanylate cyclase n=1 Tax=Desulfocurvibacter africanus TaxID=873 RepID=UPI002FDB8759